MTSLGGGAAAAAAATTEAEREKEAQIEAQGVRDNLAKELADVSVIEGGGVTS